MASITVNGRRYRRVELTAGENTHPDHGTIAQLLTEPPITYAEQTAIRERAGR